MKNYNFIEKDHDDGHVGEMLEEDWGLMTMAQLNQRN
jgi:hypothetical protein